MYKVLSMFYDGERPLCAFTEKNFIFRKRAVKYAMSIESVGVRTNSTLEELERAGLSAKAEVYDRNCKPLLIRNIKIELDKEAPNVVEVNR